MKPAPLGLGITAIYRLGPVEAGIPPGNEITVEVRDVTVGVCKDRVIRRVGLKLHRLPVLLVVLRLSASVRLGQRLDRLLHYAEADPLAVRLADDGPVMGTVNGKLLFGQSLECLVWDGDLGCHYRTQVVAVSVEKTISLFLDCLQILVDGVYAARSMHPAGAFIEALIDEELAPRGSAVNIQSF